MLKKAFMLTLLAAAIFATPSTKRSDDPIPFCLPCPVDQR